MINVLNFLGVLFGPSIDLKVRGADVSIFRISAQASYKAPDKACKRVKKLLSKVAKLYQKIETGDVAHPPKSTARFLQEMFSLVTEIQN